MSAYIIKAKDPAGKMRTLHSVAAGKSHRGLLEEHILYRGVPVELQGRAGGGNETGSSWRAGCTGWAETGGGQPLK